MTRVLMVSVEPPWPAEHGGRLRTARVAEGLGRALDVLVAFPDHGPQASDPPVPCEPLPFTEVSAARSRLSARPHLGGHYLDGRATADALVRLAGRFRPDAVYWSHSYLAACAPPPLRQWPQVVEFANLESRRLRTLVPAARGLRRVARRVEAIKAAWWEPRLARAAALSVALSDVDQSVLSGWGATVVLAPNGVDEVPYVPSPPDGYALAMASYDYEPNVLAVRRLVREVWPRVLQRRPQARLVVAGRGSEALNDLAVDGVEVPNAGGISVIGTLADVTAVYAGAAVALAPAATGGGSQLKLTEALSRGRCLVMSPFAAPGLPGPLRGGDATRVAAGPDEFAEAIVTAMTKVDDRHRREHSGWRHCQPLGWARTSDTLVRSVLALARSPR